MSLLPTPFQPGVVDSLELRPEERIAGAGPAPAQRLAEADLSTPRRCPTCGGSGVLRLSAMGFRTCLDCAGQGMLPVVPARSAFEPQPQLGQALDQLMASTRPQAITRSSERLSQDLPL